MTQQGYPPGPGFGQFPGLPGIPQQQPQQPAQQQYPPQPQGYPPPQQQPGGLPPAPSYPGAQPPTYAAPPPPAQQGFYPVAQQPQGYPPPPAQQPAYGTPYAQPGAPVGGMPGPVAQGIQGKSAGGRRFSGADMSGVRMTGAKHPFLYCFRGPSGTYVDGSPAQYVLEVDKTMQTDRKGSFVVEAIVRYSSNPEVKVNTKVSWIQGTKDLDIALPAIKRFVVSTMGADTEEQLLAAGHNMAHMYSAITDDQNHMIDPDTRQPLMYGPNPLKGKIVACTVNPPHGQDRQGRPSVFQRTDFVPYRAG